MMDATVIKMLSSTAIFLLLLASVFSQQIEAHRSEDEPDHEHEHHSHGHEEFDDEHHHHHGHGQGQGQSHGEGGFHVYDENHQQRREPTNKELHDHSQLRLHSRAHHHHEYEHEESEEHHDHHDHHPHAHDHEEEEEEGHSDEVGSKGHHDHNHDHDHHDHHSHSHPVHTRSSNVNSGVWLKAMGCSLLVSLASLICLLLLPLIAMHGRPSKTWVDALAGFGAGSMLGDALLHQLPHAFGGSGGHSHSHSHSHNHNHNHNHAHDHENGGGGHAHSLDDLSVGLAALGGILLFFVVEKIVRRSEELASSRGRGGGKSFGHHHHHHHHHHLPGKKDDSEEDERHDVTDKAEKDVDDSRGDLRKRTSTVVRKGIETVPSSETDSGQLQSSEERREGKTFDDEQNESSSSTLVLGYLNLVSDGVHNFTDGMALGSAFLLRGTVGGWSRTLFLLTHELPQEVGDYGILLSSGFGVVEALAFNFLSALMAVAGTALALLIGGGDSTQSKMVEGFTGGGFIYVSIGAVMAGMHSQGNSFKTSASQVAALCLGMSIALAISLAE